MCGVKEKMLKRYKSSEGPDKGCSNLSGAESEISDHSRGRMILSPVFYHSFRDYSKRPKLYYTTNPQIQLASLPWKQNTRVSRS